MKMFESFLKSIPSNRSEMVNELELPDITVSPYFCDLEDSSTSTSDSIITETLSSGAEEFRQRTLSTDSSVPLSRAMTDSEIDYDRYRRYKNRSHSDPRDEMKAAVDNFPPGHLDSLKSFEIPSSETIEEQQENYRRDRLRSSEELVLKMKRFLEECRVFAADDPGLEDLKEALSNVDMKALEAELDSIKTAFSVPLKTMVSGANNHS